MAGTPSQTGNFVIGMVYADQYGICAVLTFDFQANLCWVSNSHCLRHYWLFLSVVVQFHLEFWSLSCGLCSPHRPEDVESRNTVNGADHDAARILCNFKTASCSG